MSKKTNICKQLELINDRLVVFSNIENYIISHIKHKNGLYIKIPDSLIVSYNVEDKLYIVQKDNKIVYSEECPPSVFKIMEHSLSLDRIKRFCYNCAFYANATYYAANVARAADYAADYATDYATDSAADVARAADYAADYAARAAYCATDVARAVERERQSQFIKRLYRGQKRIEVEKK